MANLKRTKRRIRRHVDSNSLLWRAYDNWYVGVTSDISRRRNTHERKRGRELRTFQSWKVRSARQAAELERRFLEMGMQGAGGGWTDKSCYVYVYKVRGPYA